MLKVFVCFLLVLGIADANSLYQRGLMQRALDNLEHQLVPLRDDVIAGLLTPTQASDIFWVEVTAEHDRLAAAAHTAARVDAELAPPTQQGDKWATGAAPMTADDHPPLATDAAATMSAAEKTSIDATMDFLDTVAGVILIVVAVAVGAHEELAQCVWKAVAADLATIAAGHRVLVQAVFALARTGIKWALVYYRFLHGLAVSTLLNKLTKACALIT